MSLSRKPQFKSGWRFGLFAGAISCTVVFIVNLSALIWAMSGRDTNDASHLVLLEGLCADTRNLNTGLHLAINALSSVMLAASNYGMQCLSAPTRADVDKAHSEGKWMDIGVPSVHNLRRLPTKRVVLWSLLIFSSLPLHLVYNSVIYSTIVTVGDYNIWTAQSADHDLGQAEFFNRRWNVTVGEWVWSPDLNETWRRLASEGVRGKLTKLDNLECIRQYATSFQTSHQDVILVTGTKEDPDSTDTAWLTQTSVGISDLPVDEAYEWVCGGSTGGCPVKGYDRGEHVCRDKIPVVEKNQSNWDPFCKKIEYCYSDTVDEGCQLTFSPIFMAFVLASNALKAVVLFYIALRPPENSLLVLGDAVESFLTIPDAFSNDSCLASIEDIRDNDHRNWTGPRTWFPVKRRWATVISRRRWKFSLFLYSLPLSVVVFFLIFGIIQFNGTKDIRTFWNLGFGTVTELTLLGKAGSGFDESFTMTQSVLLANFPHFVFSGLYFQYNSLFTGMLAANEWSDFGRKRKGLRVSSDPRGDQRSRYFLQLPYRWSIPLILMSMLIHWMISQSIFLVAIGISDKGKKRLATTCGYSLIAIFAVIVAALVMAIAVIITGYRRLVTTIPVVGSCSLGIAAACHGLGGAERPDEALVPLRWGAMTHPEETTGGVEEPGHCGFSGDYVEEPYEGGLYS
ncbi:hypothetical protein CDV36_012599 [Fusarium kuroshium]|uniref:DUF6536 domain-containing protein n=1 Tax=Fusarium kuroshium TaxID=2010991 RepID=A0A3M2RRF7_9HYPO|nr:hypothetical protein CDV36_012599 [Fusarium kuroshium]